MSRALLAVADGNEDIETITLLDVLRRAGIQVQLTSVEDRRQVTLARGTRLATDATLLESLSGQFDMVLLPGGMPGAQRLANHRVLHEWVRRHVIAGKLYGAICAAPAIALEPWGLLDGRRATCYPGLRDRLTNVEYVDEPVVRDGNCITSQGPATVQAFALAVVDALEGRDAARAVRHDLLADRWDQACA